jgi:hypothetical protein
MGLASLCNNFCGALQDGHVEYLQFNFVSSTAGDNRKRMGMFYDS